jgi:hypothetical protein
MTGNRPARYRPKATVEAMRWRPDQPDAAGALIGWLIAAGAEYQCPSGAGSTTTLAVRHADRGWQTADPGDWIIRGVTGQFFPLTDIDFQAAYLPVDIPIKTTR